jgi:hypothetical protein
VERGGSGKICLEESLRSVGKLSGATTGNKRGLGNEEMGARRGA